MFGPNNKLATGVLWTGNYISIGIQAIVFGKVGDNAIIEDGGVLGDEATLTSGVKIGQHLYWIQFQYLLF